MKKKILAALTAVIAGLFVFTGCQDEKPYATYELACNFSGLPEKPDNGMSYDEWVESLPAAEKDLMHVADYLAGWMISHGYVMTRNLNNPIVLEGDNLTLLDPQAYQVYQNKIADLDKVDLDDVITEAQNQTGSGTKLELTTDGMLSFGYVITGITTMATSSYPQIQWYSVSYGPSTSNPDQNPDSNLE